MSKSLGLAPKPAKNFKPNDRRRSVKPPESPEFAQRISPSWWFIWSDSGGAAGAFTARNPVPVDRHPSSEINDVIGRLPDLVPRVDLDSLKIFLEELLSWNPRLGLISKQDSCHVAARLLRRSAALWDFVAEKAGLEQGTARVVDIGSGGGFPGVVWKLLAPNLRIVLLERKARRAFFLERLAFRLKIEGIDVINGDLREISLREGQRDAYTVATMMAVSPPGQLAEAVERILEPRGVFCSIRGLEGDVTESVGDHLSLVASASGEDSRYVLYRKG
jgi:16S rRNA (guanine527-N7)-methyltransferase